MLTFIAPTIPWGRSENVSERGRIFPYGFLVRRVATKPDDPPGNEIDLLFWTAQLLAHTGFRRGARCRSGSIDHGKEKHEHDMRDAGVQLVCPEPEQFTENEPIHRVNWQAKKRS
ncbi:MAG: hypothetical protein ACJ8KF_16405 [Chthoniobacterales bacterium]